jgi:phenylacetate-CoA ligase
MPTEVISNQTYLNGALDAVYESIVYAQKNAPFYQKQLRDFNLKFADFTAQSITQIPFTTKADIAAQNSDFLSVPIDQIAEYCTTSGTSGSPITIFLTKQDLLRLAQNEARSFRLTGASSSDVFQLLTTIDKQFMAGLAYMLGVRELSAGLIRIGPGVPEMQWKSIFLNRPTVLIAVPSFIVSLIDYAVQHKIDMNASSVRSIICIGEPIRNEDFTLNTLGKKITSDWQVDLYSTYASTEMAAAFTECTEKNGCHLNNDLLYLEVLDEQGNEVQDGEIGEVVITTLGTQGTPLIRFKTGDMARIHKTRCKCGDYTPRLGPIVGRKNQLIKYKGTSIFPNTIFEILDASTEIFNYQVQISDNEFGNDEITILLSKELEGSVMLSEIKDRFRSNLKTIPKFEFHQKTYINSIVYPNNMRKPQKILFNKNQS